MKCARRTGSVLLALLCWSSKGTTQAAVGTLASASGVSLAAMYQQRRDDVLNPARHSGFGVAIQMLADRPSRRRSSRFQLELRGGPLASRFDPALETVAAGLRVAYRRVGLAGSPNGEISAWLGAELEGSTEFAYFTNWDDSHFYWLTSYSLGFAGTIQYALSPQRTWLIEWSIPVVALVSRPDALIPYKTDNPRMGWILSRLHHGLRLTSLHEHREVDLTLRYIRTDTRFARSLFVRSEYALTDVSGSQPLRSFRHSLGATLGWGRARSEGR